MNVGSKALRSAAQPNVRALALAVLLSLTMNGLARAQTANAPFPVTVQAVILPAEGDQPVRLGVTATITKGWHVYSVTQPPGGPVRTKISLDDDKTASLAGDFAAAPLPEKKAEPLFGGITVETHHDAVSWIAPLKLPDGAGLNQLELKGKVRIQACDATTCLPPVTIPFAAKLKAKAASQTSAPSVTPAVAVSAKSENPAAVAEPKAGESVGSYTHPQTHAVIRGQITPGSAQPGSTVQLQLTAEPQAPFHVYPLGSKPVDGPNKPTLIVIESAGDLLVGQPTASAGPTEHAAPGEAGKTVYYYDQPVTWTVPIQIPADAQPGPRTVRGIIGFQTCREAQCDFPRAARFEATVKVGGEAAASVPLAFADAKYGEAAALLSGPTAAPAAREAFAWIILLGLAGGLMLNLMPCVFPVIGLKLLAFVEQGGQSRTHVLALNLWYSLGVLSVFMVLATLATTLSFGWGEHFQSSAFNIVMAAVVFVMALSFLNVWEIPLPGFAGSGKAAAVAAQEGAVAAFLKGILSTVLSTPCSGPLLGGVFAYTLGVPAWKTFAIFGSIALGMSSPYLLIGAFPSLIRFLPKPGAWMDTFKQIMGFVMLATVVVLFKFFIRPAYFVPTLALLFTLWAACWWIGRVPLYETLGKRLAAWAQAAAFAGALGFASFTLLGAGQAVLQWQPFSQPTLDMLTRQGKTVMVDFTADWCLTCQVNYKWAIDTKDVAQVVDRNDVAPLIADWTEESDEIKRALNALGSNSIPLLVIFPAGRPHEPIILRDLLTESQVLEALEQAGPSSASAEPRVADVRGS